jgi:hypothetical protein
VEERLKKIEEEAERARQALDEVIAGLAELRAPAQAAPESPAEPVVADPPPSTEVQGARLIALKMAMDGASRDEVAAHLAEELGIADSDALLDEVFARAAG